MHNTLSKLNIVYLNIRGIKGKLETLEEILYEADAHIVCLVETHLHEEGKALLKDYKPVATKVRKEKGGGGMIVLCKPHLANIMQRIPSEEEESEILWVKLSTSQVKVKVALVYFPQETKTKTTNIRSIYKELEKEVKIGREKDETILILGDFNCKIGRCIQHNSTTISKGGRELLRWTKSQNMIILNKTDKCSGGTWTRHGGSSKSVLYYVLI